MMDAVRFRESKTFDTVRSTFCEHLRLNQEDSSSIKLAISGNRTRNASVTDQFRRSWSCSYKHIIGKKQICQHHCI